MNKWWKITDAALCSGTVSFIYIMWTNYWARVAALESRYSAAADIGLGGARPGHRPPNSRHSLARIDKEEVSRSGNKTVAPVFLFSQSQIVSPINHLQHLFSAH